jgi:hypothetical protein
VSIGADGTVDGGTIDGAIGTWHGVLHWDQFGSLPQLNYTTGANPSILVSQVNTSANGLYCGKNDPVAWIRFYGTDSECQSQRLGGIYDVLVHELSEVLGLDEDFEKYSSPADCSVHISGLTSLNSTPCAQEVEYIFAGYGLTTVDPSNIWNQTVVTGVSLATNELTVEVGSPRTDSVLSIRTDAPGMPPTTTSAQQASYHWISRNPLVASVPASGRVVSITATGPGATYVQAVASATSITNGVVGTVAKRLGDSVKVTVPAPPPAGTNFRVSDITGPPVPITQAGAASLHAVVEDPFNEYFQVKWDISYSNGSHEPVHSDYYPSPGYTLPVPAGSYRITVTATARSEGQVRSHTSYFPVCTGSGGGGGGGGKGGPLLRAPLPDSLVRQLPDSSTGHTPAGPGNGGAGTDAVGGC